MKNKEHNVCLFIVKEKLFVTSSTAASTDIFLLHGANGERSGRGETRTASKMQKTLENCAGLIFKTCSAGAQSSTAVSKLTCVIVQFPPGTAALRTERQQTQRAAPGGSQAAAPRRGQRDVGDAAQPPHFTEESNKSQLLSSTQ